MRVYFSNHVEELVQELARLLRRRSSPLDAWDLSVPHRGLERYLEVQLSESLGILANVRFGRIDRLLRSSLTDQLVKQGLPSAIASVDTLDRCLLKILLEQSGNPLLSPVMQFAGLPPLGNKGDEGAESKSFKWDAKKLSEFIRAFRTLLEAYILHRPEMLARWDMHLPSDDLALSKSSNDHETWQRELYRLLQETLPANTQLLHHAVKRLEETPFPSPSLPNENGPKSTLIVFANSYFAPLHLRAFRTLGATRDVHLLMLNPCGEFWLDLPSKKVGKREQTLSTFETSSGLIPSPSPYPSDADDDFEGVSELFVDSESQLLAQFGQALRTQVETLEQESSFDAPSSFLASEGSSLLHEIQNSILERRPIDTSNAAASSEPTVRIAIAPSKRREVEWVAGSILRILNNQSESPVKLSEIGVLIAGRDRDTYLSLIDAVFRESFNLPWTTSEVGMRGGSRLAEGAVRMLELLVGQISRANFMRVIAHPNWLPRVRSWEEALRAGSDRGDSASLSGDAALSGFAARAGVHFGLKSKDLQGTYLSPRFHHWDQAIFRTAASMTVGEGHRDELFPFSKFELPLFPISFADEEALRFVREARPFWSDLSVLREACMPMQEWQSSLSAWFETYLAPRSPKEKGEMERVLQTVSELFAGEPTASLEVDVDLAVNLLIPKLLDIPGPATSGAPFGVQVGSLDSMRAVPLQYAFVLGMDQGSFPRSTSQSSFDLRLQKPRKTDISNEERDRLTFLETLVSTRTGLFLSYVGRDAETGLITEPSIAVLELERLLQTSVREEIPLERFLESESLLRALPMARLEREAFSLHQEIIEGHDVEAEPDADQESARARTIFAWLQNADPKILAWAGIHPLPITSTGAPEKSLDAQPFSSFALRSRDLFRFLECPVGGSVRYQLNGNSLRSHKEFHLQSEHEPLVPEDWDLAEIGRAALSRLLTVEPQLRTRAFAREEIRRLMESSRARGLMPEKPLGELARRSLDMVIQTWIHEARHARPSDLRFLRLGEAENLRSIVVVQDFQDDLLDANATHRALSPLRLGSALELETNASSGYARDYAVEIHPLVFPSQGIPFALRYEWSTYRMRKIDRRASLTADKKIRFELAAFLDYVALCAHPDVSSSLREASRMVRIVSAAADTHEVHFDALDPIEARDWLQTLTSDLVLHGAMDYLPLSAFERLFDDRKPWSMDELHRKLEMQKNYDRGKSFVPNRNIPPSFAAESAELRAHVSLGTVAETAALFRRRYGLFCRLSGRASRLSAFGGSPFERSQGEA